MKTKKMKTPKPAAIEAKKTDAEQNGLTGKVKQVQRTCYKAHLKAGMVVQGKIELTSTFGLSNEICTYNINGQKIKEQNFNQFGTDIKVINDKGQLTEMSNYNNEGGLRTKLIFIYNEQGKQLESISRLADGSLFYRTEEKYDEQGKHIEHLQYSGVEERIISHEIHSYNEKGNLVSLIDYNIDGSIKSQWLHKYDEQGRAIEQIREYTAKENLRSNTKQTYKYNQHGDCTEMIYYKFDGSIDLSLTFIYKYNEHGNRIETSTYRNGNLEATHIIEYDSEDQMIVHKPKDREELEDQMDEKSAVKTKQYEYDSHGNWIKKTIFYKKIPSNILIREITYWDESSLNEMPLVNSHLSLGSVPITIDQSTNVPMTNEPTTDEPKTNELIHPLSYTKDIINTSNPLDELTEQQAQWLVDAPNATPDNFPALRYYAMLNKEAPSIISYSGDYEALALLHDLKGVMTAQIVNTYTTVRDGNAKQLTRYTLSFSCYGGYLLCATGLVARYEEEFDIPHYLSLSDEYRGYGNVYTSQLQFYCPSDASGKRDKEFEEEVGRLIERCLLSKKPDKPTIQIIEVRNQNFAMVEHQVNDNFEIRDLDVNYGFGFAKFHNDLMHRFNTSTKGLVLFHGLPGTGKTYYIRHLLKKMASGSKVVIYIPPNMVDHLVEPSFMTFLADEVKSWNDEGKFCVLLIEDAEPLLAKRQEGVRIQGVTNLLNMSDGILNDMLNMQIICTFNVDLKKLDSALLRPGRLIARKEFKALSELDANILAQRLGIKHHFKKPMTLSEIYALLENKNTLIHDVESEKGASTAIDDL